MKHSMEFLDIVENGYASERNPHRTGIFIKDKGKTLEFTDGKGHFWETFNDSQSRFKVIGNLLKDIKATESPSHGVTAAEEDVYGNDCKSGECS